MNLSLVSPFIIFDTVVFDLHSHEVKKARGERKKRKFCLSKASLFSFSDNCSFCSWECCLDFFGSFFNQVKNEHNYFYTGNRLTGISEAGSSQKGFKAASASYDYDVNGNMIADSGKGISSISYNHLNLPESITIDGSNINYQYDASGIKMKKVAAGTTTEYSGATVYKDDKLEFIHMPEGYIEPHNNGYRYVYRLTDHLGNTRVSFFKNTVTNKADVLDTNDYYPFGLEHQKAENTASSSNLGQNWKFQGQERSEDLGLIIDEWKYRISDPSIGRFWQLDPLAEDYVYNSTYAFQENKLGLGIELEGLELHRQRGGIKDFFNGASKVINESKNVKREMSISGKFGSESADRARIERNTNISDGLSDIRTGIRETAKGTSFTVGDVLDKGGDVTEKGALFLAIPTGGISLGALPFAEGAQIIGKSIKAAVNISDGDYDKAAVEASGILISKGASKAAAKAIKSSESLGKLTKTQSTIQKTIIGSTGKTFEETGNKIVNKKIDDENK